MTEEELENMTEEEFKKIAAALMRAREAIRAAMNDLATTRRKQNDAAAERSEVSNG